MATVPEKVFSPDSPAPEMYLALLTYQLTDEETGEFIEKYRLRKSYSQTLRDTRNLKNSLGELADPDIRPSRIYHLLHGYSRPALSAISVAGESAAVKQNVDLFSTKLRYVRSSLSGNDLQKMGITPGPPMKEILRHLLEARLNGEVTDKKGEIKLAEELASR